MRILITGGFGFLGGRLGCYLAQTGHEVVLGSRRANDPPDWLSQVETAKVIWDDQSVLDKICYGTEAVIHAAGMNAQECNANEESALSINGFNTAHLVRSAIKASVKKFIYISTAQVYASPLVGTIIEEDSTTNPHPYATSHLVGENAVLLAKKKALIEGIVLRLSNCIGAPMHSSVNCWMLLVNNLCRQVVEKGEMVLLTNGLQQRDFITMSNFCRIVENILTHDTEVCFDPIVNVGSGKSLSVLDMAHLIQQRSEIVLGIIPKIKILNKNNSVNNFEKLIFRIDKLKKFGMKINNNMSEEIDEILIFSKKHFQKLVGFKS